MADRKHDGRLTELGRRIDAARARHAPPKRREDTTASFAWRMVTELVVGLVVGGAIGWGLDSLFGTMPVFLIVMGLFGFAAGVRLVLRAAAEMGEKPRDETKAAPGDGSREATRGGADRGDRR